VGMEMYPVSVTFCSLKYQIMKEAQILRTNIWNFVEKADAMTIIQL
jgi:hypothetical protein